MKSDLFEIFKTINKISYYDRYFSIFLHEREI